MDREKKLIVNGEEIKLSKKAKAEIAEIEKEVRGDMTDKEWAFFKTIKCVTPIDEYLRLEKEAGNDIVARNPSHFNRGKQ